MIQRALIALGLLALAASAHAQDVTNPSPPNSVNGAYNSSAPTCTDGHGCWLQTDINGNLKVVTAGSPSDVQDINIKQVQGAAPSATNPIWVAPATANVPWAISAATGSIASGSIAAGAQVDLLTMRGTKAAGTAAVNSILAGHVYNSTIPTLTDGQQAAAQADTTAAIRINTEGGKATYRVAANGGIDAAGVILQIQGSGTKTIRITQVTVTGKLTVGADGIIVVQRYSTAASGGTSGSPTITPLDSTNAAATAVVLNYATVPTAGTSVGAVGLKHTFWPAPTAISGPLVEWNFGARNGQSIVLRGTSQYFAVRTASFASYTGSDYTVDVEWTEE